MAPLEQLGLRPGRLRLHDLHRQLGTARRADRQGDRGERPRRRGRPVGQPQLRGPDPSARAGQLSRLAAARRRVRARRPGRRRPDARAARHAARTAGRSCSPTSGPRSRRSARVIGDVDRPGAVPPDLRGRLRRRRALAGAADPGGRPLRLGSAVDLHRQAAVLRRAGGRAGRPSPTSRARASSRSSATPSRPTTSRRPARSPPGRRPGAWLQEHGVAPLEFNSYGARRGHHEVMMRGTFGEHPAAQRARRPARRARTRSTSRTARSCSSTTPRCATGRRASPLIVIAGREYGSGSSRDWAAKGPDAPRASARSSPRAIERIHRSNLVGMGVLPLQFLPGESAVVARADRPRDLHDPRPGRGPLPAEAADGRRPVGHDAGGTVRGERRFEAIARLDGPDRRRLLPARRDPAGGPAAARRRGLTLSSRAVHAGRRRLR